MTNNQALFITGTDTDVGKTYITALLFDFLHQNKWQANYQKLVSTGAEQSPDLAYIFAQIPQAKNNQINQSPYNFLKPASPHYAAQLEKRQIDPVWLHSQVDIARKQSEILLLEGVGGIMVPLTKKLLLVDFIKQLAMPVIIICRSGLGTINQSLLTIEALKKRNIFTIGAILSDEKAYGPEEDGLILENEAIINEYCSVLGRMPRCNSFTTAKSHFLPIGHKIMELLNSCK